MDFVKKITINYKILLFVKEFMKSNEWRDGLEFSSKGFFFFLLTRKKTIPPLLRPLLMILLNVFFSYFSAALRVMTTTARNWRVGSLLKKRDFKAYWIIVLKGI